MTEEEYKSLERENLSIPHSVVYPAGWKSDSRQIVENICNTVAGCTFMLATAWVIVSLFGR